MHAIVLGAGVTGVTTAWYLRQSGFEVTVIDRQPAAGMETSYANGGQISVSHAEPWANPGAPLKVLKWLMKEDAPLLFRLRADPAQWRWGLQFLRECTPGRTAHNIRNIVNLGLYSRDQLQRLRAATGIAYDQRQQGILHFYTSEQEYAAAQEPARIMREQGCELDMKTPEECVAIEPALAQCRAQIVGGSMTPSDESGDAHRFTQALADLAAQAGVKFRYQTRVLGFEREGQDLARVIVADANGEIERLGADRFVLCLGSFSRGLARELGVSLNIYPAKGYSMTLPMISPAHSYQVSLTDDEYKLVFSRLGNRLRVAGTAELNGYDSTLNLRRCEALLRRTRELFPQMVAPEGQPSGAQYWTGLRPATPSNLPYIGASRVGRLFLNTGHGTLGWTHSCGSAAALADLICGRRPELDYAFCGPEVDSWAGRAQAAT